MAKKSSFKKRLKSKQNIELESIESNKEESKKDELKPKSKNNRELQNEEGLPSQQSTGVIYVGHLPWGFVDSTLKKYFSQFGNITRIISPKSSKTGRSVGYAFIEFEDEETARIAAKTMNNYILFEKILKCNFVEDKKKYDRIFLKWKKKFEFKEKYKAHCEKMSKPKSKEEIKTMIQGLLDREEQRREKIKELGIKYDYKGFKEIIEEYKKNHINEIKEKQKNRKKENKNEIIGSKEDKKRIIQKHKIINNKKGTIDGEKKYEIASENEGEESEDLKNKIEEEEEDDREENVENSEKSDLELEEDEEAENLEKSDLIEEEEEEEDKKEIKRKLKEKKKVKKIESVRKKTKLEKIEKLKKKINKRGKK